MIVPRSFAQTWDSAEMRCANAAALESQSKLEARELETRPPCTDLGGICSRRHDATEGISLRHARAGLEQPKTRETVENPPDP